MQEYTHNCVKCSAQYKTNDPDPYYCSPCDEKRKVIAQQVDKNLSMRPRRKAESGIAQYDRLKNARGFVNIRDLGIKL